MRLLVICCLRTELGRLLVYHYDRVMPTDASKHKGMIMYILLYYRKAIQRNRDELAVILILYLALHPKSQSHYAITPHISP